MKKPIRITIIFLPIALWACAAQVPDISSVDVNNLAETQSLLIFSTAAESTCISFSSSAVVKSVDVPPVLSRSVGGMQMNNRFVESHFDDEYALVHSMVLSPGEYEFWLYSQNPSANYPDPVLSQAFSLAAGKISYVGEIHATGCGRVSIRLSDERSRDLEYLKKTNPDLNLEMVEISPLIPREQRPAH